LNRARTARGHATRARLLAAAESVFGEKGFHDASIHEITMAAGIGQGTFYFYFPGKLELFRALLMDLSRQLREVTSEATSLAPSRLEAERLALGAFFGFARSHRNLYRLIRTADLVEPGLGRQYYESFATAYTHVLKRAQQTGELRCLDPESVAWCLIGVAEALHMRWMEWEGIEPPPHVMDAVMAFISHGIGPVEIQPPPLGWTAVGPFQ
jgi:AcrR family transcriptional regulator